jgi:hypothetical protein
LFKYAHGSLLKKKIGIKKLEKGKLRWDKACIEVSSPIQKLKTLMKTWFASKVILLQETLNNVDAIKIYYHKQSFHLQFRMPLSLTWAIICAITKALTCALSNNVFWTNWKNINSFQMHYRLPSWPTLSYKNNI